jgi:type IV pilus modification protein PilV
MRRAHHHHRQHGVTLIEALVALLIMAFGMLAMVGMQGNMRRSADHAKQRSEAVRLAQGEMELLRAFSVLTPPNGAPAGTRAYDGIQTASKDSAGDPNSNAVFALTRTVSVAGNERPSEVLVEVKWKDRADVEQAVAFRSFISKVDPKLSGSLGIPPDGAPTRRPLGRDVGIPASAKDLGDGYSTFKPPAVSSGVVWVFNNLTGRIVKLCALPDLSITLTAANYAAYCSDISPGYLLSGHVRFSYVSPPNAANPTDTALPLDMAITEVDTAHPAPSHQCFDNAPLSPDGAMLDGVAFFCAVFPDISSDSWNGRLQVGGISLGSGAYRICRYSADYDGDGKIANNEHPLDYLAVKEALNRQNFLVVKATESCPAGTAAHQE